MNLRAGSFAKKVKEELASLPIRNETNRCCQVSELSALIYSASTLSVDDGNQLTLCVVSRSEAAIARSQALASALLGKRVESSNWPEDLARQILTSCGLFCDQGWFQASDPVPPIVLQRQCCKGAFLRGVFLGAGSVADPAKEYHLEFVTCESSFARTIEGLLEGLRLAPRMVIRKSQYVIYIKESEMIARLLTWMGAVNSRLALEDARILKEMRNQVNRATNCDSANLDKAIDVAARQIEAIGLIKSRVGLGSLPDALRETAEIRLQNPELPLAELGRLLSPTVGKSGVNHRLRKLEEIARTIKLTNYDNDSHVLSNKTGHD